MKLLEIKGKSGVSKIMVGEKLQNLQQYVPAKKAVIITDTNVFKHYKNDFPSCDIIIINTGEKIKNLDTVRHIYDKLLEFEADRSTFLIGIGGGIVCDITGFAASTFLRGIRFGFVASTLLAQVDASVGGKNGVNYEGYKNIIGVFNQPEFVICDINLLNTLPEREILCGIAEIIKHAAIESSDLFTYIEQHSRHALALDPVVLKKLVVDSVVIKSTIVNKDEKEKGERRKLNFGHTFGHAYEKITGAPHGEAVSAGMVMAALISVNRGKLLSADAERIIHLIEKFHLPARFQVDDYRLADALGKDKKREDDGIHFVLLNRIGHAFVEKISLQQLSSEINDKQLSPLFAKQG